MTLFGDEVAINGAAIANGATIITVGMAAVATVGSAITAYFGYRTTRDKMEFDAERVEMKKDISHLKEKVENCHKERQQMEAEVADLRRRWDERSALHTSLDRRHENDPNYDGPKTRREDTAPPQGK